MADDNAARLVLDQGLHPPLGAAEAGPPVLIPVSGTDWVPGWEEGLGFMATKVTADRAAMLAVYGGSTGRECLGFIWRTTWGPRIRPAQRDLGTYATEREAADAISAAAAGE